MRMGCERQHPRAPHHREVDVLEVEGKMTLLRLKMNAIIAITKMYPDRYEMRLMM